MHINNFNIIYIFDHQGSYYHYGVYLKSWK